MIEATFMVGGEAGQGVQSVGYILSRIFASGGYYVFSDRDYESRVRGGHNFFRIRVGDTEVSAINETLNIIVALNKETIDLHKKELTKNGIIIFDSSITADVKGGKFVGVPLTKLAEEKAGNKLMSNTVALGACLGLVGYKNKSIKTIFTKTFGRESSEANMRAFNAGYEYITSTFQNKFPIKLQKTNGKSKLLLNGNEALALGSIASGCKLIAAYPMTPASSIMEYMALHEEDMGITVIQAEDEIAAINMAVGAGYTGIRAMTATSGSGLCLMVEGLGLAGLAEIPVVIVDAQRPGPAVGLPTRTEQGDLQFVLHAHHSDFPRVVLAPSTIEDAFYTAVKAFNLAEKYQIPVVILTDHLLATSYQTVPDFDFRKVTIDRGNLYNHDNGIDPHEYKRYEVTRSGISTRAFPGLSEALVVSDSHGHSEAGHPIEDADTQIRQVDKRLRKNKRIEKEIHVTKEYGPEKPETLIVSWGSSFGAVKEAVDVLNRRGMSIGLVNLNEIWPFPGREVSQRLNQAQRTLVLEGNASGQLARLIRAETGIKVDGKILKYDGRPFTPSYIIGKITKGDV